jgi:hypothetical protein
MEANNYPPSKVEAKEGVQLYPHFISGFSWPVSEQTYSHIHERKRRRKADEEKQHYT